MKKRIISILLSLLLLSACGAKAETTTETTTSAETTIATAAANETTTADAEETTAAESADSFYFEYQGQKLFMSADVAPSVDALGEPLSYFEDPSCAFDGIDKTYTYNGFEITTYPNESTDKIYSIYLTSDTVSTAEGIAVGAGKDALVAAYGSDYTEVGTQYQYVRGNCNLLFALENDVVTSIEYLANDAIPTQG